MFQQDCQFFKFIRGVERLMIHALHQLILQKILTSLLLYINLQGLANPHILLLIFFSNDRLSLISRSLIATLDCVSVPKTVKEALHHPGWSNVMFKEIYALDENHT